MPWRAFTFPKDFSISFSSIIGSITFVPIKNFRLTSAQRLRAKIVFNEDSAQEHCTKHRFDPIRADPGEKDALLTHPENQCPPRSSQDRAVTSGKQISADHCCGDRLEFF